MCASSLFCPGESVQVMPRAAYGLPLMVIGDGSAVALAGGGAMGGAVFIKKKWVRVESAAETTAA